MGTPWRRAVQDWKAGGGVVVHLTVYGENVQTSDVFSRIKATDKNVMLLVGSQKVPGEFYSEEVSDFNVAVGNQPHSECSALAIFLDRFFEGKELAGSFECAKISVVPKARGKKSGIYRFLIDAVRRVLFQHDALLWVQEGKSEIMLSTIDDAIP
jgi:tRNA (cytidine56-2'-O)-methyltransferase